MWDLKKRNVKVPGLKRADIQKDFKDHVSASTADGKKHSPATTKQENPFLSKVSYQYKKYDP